jgi:hypothetical protein
MNRRDALAALVSLPAAARISVAELKTNDVIVVECDMHMRPDTAERIRAHVQKVWPESEGFSSG